MKLYRKIRFPCGYEYEENFEISSWLVSNGTLITDKDYPICSIHGKKCRRHTKWKKIFLWAE